MKPRINAIRNTSKIFELNLQVDGLKHWQILSLEYFFVLGLSMFLNYF